MTELQTGVVTLSKSRGRVRSSGSCKYHLYSVQSLVRIVIKARPCPMTARCLVTRLTLFHIVDNYARSFML